MMRVTIHAPKLDLRDAIAIEEYARALHSRARRFDDSSVSFVFDEVADTQKFISTLADKGLEFTVAPQ